MVEVRKMVEYIELGDLDAFEEEWFEALKALAIKKISEATGEPCEFAMGIGCNADEALHVVTTSGRVFHVGYADVLDVFAVEEVQCPRCGCYVPTNVLEEHEKLCVGGE